MRLLNEKSKTGRTAFTVPADTLSTRIQIPSDQLRDDLNLPELAEVDVIRHYTGLSRLNFGVDNGFYPLGSCTMKYNPKINEVISKLPDFNIHPLSDYSQGCLQVIDDMEKALCEITGMAAVTLQPAAGAHGELTAMMMVKSYYQQKGETRSVVLIPDSAHGTNPASAGLCGFEIVEVKSDPTGSVDLADLESKLNSTVAAFMLTNPNTVGLFDKNILTITQKVHECGALCYMDGANMNPLLGIVKPADLGFDLMHLNLHKTFSTPHGGGGPGSGPVAVTQALAAFLPNPRVVLQDGRYEWVESVDSIGRVHAFYGNFNVILKAYTYIRALGGSGLREVAEHAVINANYMKAQLKPYFHLPYDRVCQHEFVISDQDMPNHVSTMDIAKRLIDYGIHPPTIYFPLIVAGSMMIEPTETESKETMDAFIETMIRIKSEAETQPDIVKTAPHTTPVKRLDGVLAARKPILTWDQH